MTAFSSSLSPMPTQLTEPAARTPFAVSTIGLAQTALGAIVVLMTSTINRVMVVELALPALVPGLLVAVLAGGWIPARAQDINPLQLDLAGLREDVRLLSQRVGELNIAVEQLQRENSALKGKGGTSAPAYATLAQLNQAVTELNRFVKAALAEQRSDILQEVGGQIEKLAGQTNAALDALAKGSAAPAPASAPAPAKAAVFTEDYPKQGIPYVVQRGDTLAEIARKNGATVRDIINANKIADPARIQAGQSLFIPQGKH